MQALTEAKVGHDGPMPPGEWDAIVLAGGRSSRMGHDKLTLNLGNRTLLDHALDAVAEATTVVAVGPKRPVQPGRAITWTPDDTAYPGPLAAIATALPHTASEIVVVIAGDTVGAGAAVSELLAALDAHPDRATAAGCDSAGRLQPLLAAYRREPLRQRLESLGPQLINGRAQSLLDPQTTIAIPVDAFDVDTAADRRAAEELLG